jgi:acyl carrier protein
MDAGLSMNAELQAGVDRVAVLATIRAVLAKVLERELPPTTEETPLLSGLGLDSTRVLEMLMDLEDGLRIEFDIDTLEQRNVETIGTLADYVVATMDGTSP